MIYITLRFDDGTKNQYTNAFQVMKKYDLPASIYIIGKYFLQDESYRNYINIEELREMEKAGWEIGYHSLSHYKDWIKNKNIYETETNPEVLTDEGISVNTFALPYSVYNSDVITHLSKRYDGILGMPSKIGNSMEYVAFNNLFRCYTITRNMDVESLKNRIDTAIKENQYLIFLFHKIECEPSGTWSYDLEEFTELIETLYEYQNKNLVKVITFRDALHNLKTLES